MKFTLVSPVDIGNALASAVGTISGAMGSEIDRGMSKVSQQAFEKAKDLAAMRLYTTKQEFIDALSVERLGMHVYAIRLDASAAHLDQGYERFDMKPGLLAGPVNTDPNSKGGIRVSKDGYKYRAIPFEQTSAPKNESHPQNQRKTQIGQAGESTMGAQSAIFDAIKKVGNSFSKQMGQSNDGTRWSFSKNEFNSHVGNFTMADGSQKTANFGRPISKNMDGLKHVASKSASGKVKSAYMTFRIVSENPKSASKFWHPGFKGVHILEDVQRWTEEAFSRMVEEIFSKIS